MGRAKCTMKRNSTHVLRALCEYSGVDYESGDEHATLVRKLRRRAPRSFARHAELLVADARALREHRTQLREETALGKRWHREEDDAALRRLMQYGASVHGVNMSFCRLHRTFDCPCCSRWIRVCSLRPLVVAVEPHAIYTLVHDVCVDIFVPPSAGPALDCDELHRAARVLNQLDEAVEASLPLLPELREIVKGYVGERVE